jgi:kynurenine formamidase
MLVEMSYPLSPDIPVYPGLPRDEFLPHTRMGRGEESNTTVVKHFTHNGTHVDAPFHFYIGGKTIDELPIEDFCYTKPLIVNAPLGKGGLVTPQHLEACGAALREADILLLNTGYFTRRHAAAVYADDFPALSLEAARMIRTELLNVKAVAIDTLSIESATMGGKTDFAVHKALLDGSLHPERSILIYEDVNMAPVLDRPISRIYAFPLRLCGLDGSPVTIVAEV